MVLVYLVILPFMSCVFCNEGEGFAYTYGMGLHLLLVFIFYCVAGYPDLRHSMA
jgi:hypothetical protein